MQTDHIIEMQVTPIGGEAAYDAMSNYELLDAASNRASGSQLMWNIDTMRKTLEAACDDPRWRTEPITFEHVALETSFWNAGRWSQEQIVGGEHIDAFESI